MSVNLKDADWIRQSFMLPRGAITDADAKRRVFSNASLKFTDTTLGGNFAINPLPQMTRFADLKVASRYANSRGMGRAYSEMFDDNARHVHFRYGLAEFNSLTTFFSSFYNTEAATLARTGRSPGLFYTAGKMIGFVVTIPLLPFVLAGDILRFIMRAPASKYYYLKPAMPLYWNAVTSMVNTIAVNMGVQLPAYSTEQYKFGDPAEATDAPTANDWSIYHKLLPDLFTADGGIDVYAIATRGQRLADRNRRAMIDAIQAASSSDDLRSKMQDFIDQKLSEGKRPNLPEYLKNYSATGAATPPSDPTTTEKARDPKTYDDGFADFALAELRDGAQWVTFRVNNNGSVSESFSNSTRDSDIADSINSMSASARNTRFSFADGNLGDGVISGTLEAIAGAVGDVAKGIADATHIQGIAAFGGSAFVDIPKMYDTSDVSLPRMDYTVELRSWSGDKLSRLQNIVVPLAMLLASVLPRSTGKHSYVGPFLLEFYDKGRGQSRLGIVRDMSITRGVGNMGWNTDSEALGIDVNFSIEDLSNVIHMPIAPNFSFTEPLAGIFDEDNTFGDYMAILGSLGLHDQIYTKNKLRLAWKRKMANWDSWRSPSHFANWAFGTLPGRLVSAIANNTNRS